MIRLTETREITPYVWVHPDGRGEAANWGGLTSSPVCTENFIRVDDVMESPKLVE
jgi:hypothetical protein